MPIGSFRGYCFRSTLLYSGHKKAPRGIPDEVLRGAYGSRRIQAGCGIPRAAERLLHPRTFLHTQERWTITLPHSKH